MWFRRSGTLAQACSLPALTASGGSVVDPSLLRQAADRGVTICFADLDGADGLWVPEERTVLVNRSLSEREVAAVIEHELGHVAIDDQHAELDAGVGRPPPAATRRWAPAALTAAACLAVVAGVTLGLTRDQGGALRDEPVVAPTAPPRTAGPPGPVVTTSVVIGPDGQPQVRTVTLTATPSGTPPAATTAGSIAPTATRTPSLPAPAQPSPTTPSAAPTTETTTTPAEPAPTTPSAEPTTESPAAEPGDDGDDLDDGMDGTAPGTGSVLPPALP